MKPRLLSTREVMIMTGHPQPYIYALLAMGKLKGKRVNGIWQIDAASVKQHTQRRKGSAHAVIA